MASPRYQGVYRLENDDSSESEQGCVLEHGGGSSSSLALVPSTQEVALRDAANPSKSAPTLESAESLITSAVYAHMNEATNTLYGLARKSQPNVKQKRFTCCICNRT